MRRFVVCVTVIMACAGPVGLIVFPVMPHLSVPLLFTGIMGRHRLVCLAAAGAHVVRMTSIPYDLKHTIKQWRPILTATLALSALAMLMGQGLFALATLAAGITTYFVPTTAALTKYAWVWATEVPSPAP